MLADFILVVAVIVFGFALYAALCDFVDWGFEVLDDGKEV